jgi:hypothetical protein
MKKILALLIGCGTALSTIAQTTTTEKQTANSTYQVSTPMTNEDFTSLLRKVRNHLRNDSRMEAAASAINNPAYFFNTRQLKMLLESFEGDLKRTELAKQAYSKVTDRVNFGKLDVVVTSEISKADLASFIKDKDSTIVVYSFSESFRTPMANSGFNSAMTDIQKQWQEGARLSTIIDLFDAPTSYFTVAQAKELIQLVSDEGSRLHLAKAVYPRIVDPENFAGMYDLFESPERVTTLKAYIGADEKKTTVAHNAGKTPMDEASFTSLLDDSKNSYRKKTIIKSVNNVFADANTYYTSYQARQLLLLISDESDRLTAAKAAYRGITDPQNFMVQMNDLFRVDAERATLEAYVNNYK